MEKFIIQSWEELGISLSYRFPSEKQINSSEEEDGKGIKFYKCPHTQFYFITRQAIYGILL